MPDPARVLVLAPNWLGDAVMALPAIQDVRVRFPHAQLIVAARSAVARLFSMVPIVDAIVPLEWRGRLLDAVTLRRDARALRKTSADVALLLPNSFASAFLARLGGVTERWGYASDLRTPLLTRMVERPEESVHQGTYYQHLVRSLGIASGPLEPVVTPSPQSVEDARALLLAEWWDGVRPVVVLAPGAAYGSAKQWLPRHFATLASDLVVRHGVHVVLVGSTADTAATSTVRELMAPEARPFVSDLAGQTSLEVLAGAMRLARACVSNDSGAMHLAAAVGVPLAAIFGPTNERETAPLAHAGITADVLIHHVSCRPCMLRECPIDHPCMRDLDPARVLSSVERMLAASDASS
jgi:heptosyltransferase-2